METRMPRIVIQSPYPLALPIQELRGLADDLAAQAAGLEVEVVEKEVERGRLQGPWYEVILVWIPAIGFYHDTIKRLTRWAIDRLRKDPGRPRSFTVHDADGKVLGSFLLRDADGPIVEEPIKEAKNRLPPFPLDGP